MATLTAGECTGLRQLAARRAAAVTWTKPQINAALQAIEDAAQSTSNVGPRTLKAYIGSAIETAVPGVFNAAQKDDLFVIWCRFNAARGGTI